MLAGDAGRVQAEGLFHTSPGQHALGSRRPFFSRRPTACFITISLPMPQSLSQVILHIVFSTKKRHPWVGPEIGPRMHAG